MLSYTCAIWTSDQGGLDVARKKTDAPGKAKAAPPAPSKKNLLAIKGFEEWKSWLEEFASKKRMPVTTLIDHALTELAKRDGFREPPPRY